MAMWISPWQTKWKIVIAPLNTGALNLLNGGGSKLETLLCGDVIIHSTNEVEVLIVNTNSITDDWDAEVTYGNVRCCSWLAQYLRYSISKMYFSHWGPPGVCERRRSVNLEVSISEENQILGGHSGLPSEKLRSLTTRTGAPRELLWKVWEYLGLSPNQCGNPKLTLSDAWVLMDIHLKHSRRYLRFSGCAWAIKIPSSSDA